MPEIADDAPEDAPTLADVVRLYVLGVCVACRWNLVRAAAVLGVTEKTVYNHLNRYESQGFVEYRRGRSRETGWRLKGQVS